MMPVYQTGMGGVHGKRPPPSQISRKISLFVYLLSAIIIFLTVANLGFPTAPEPSPVSVVVQENDYTSQQPIIKAPAIKAPAIKPPGKRPLDPNAISPPALVRASAVVDGESKTALVTAPARPAGIYALSVEEATGTRTSLAPYSGQVAMVVNVASQCGFTEKNYRHLQPLYDKYRDRGFTILAFPCNQFGAQEPGSNEEIVKFAQEKYGVTFPIFSKTSVNGEDTNEVFKYLKTHMPVSTWAGGKEVEGDPALGSLYWNFQKWIVGRGGEPRFFFYQDFDQGAIEAAIEQLLAEV